MMGNVFNSGKFDGIAGLSFPDPAEGIPTLFDNMM